MNIGNVVGISASGLDSIGKQLAVVSQNIANASTPGYSRQRQEISAMVAGGAGIGVRIGLTVRTVDVALQGEGFTATAAAAGGQVVADALATIDAASGSPGGGADVPSLLGGLRDAYSALSNDPSNQTQQALVVDQAGALARGVRELGRTADTARQAAQDAAVLDVAAANSALRSVGRLTIQIQNATSRGDSTAQLDDERDAALQQVTTLTGARVFHQPDGTVLALAGGLALPFDATTGPLTLAPATVGTAGGPVAPRLFVNGLDVTGQFAAHQSGELGAHLALRDTILPGVQAAVDGFAQALAAGFQAAGLTLFSDGGGGVPSVAAGFSAAIQVAPAVQAAPRQVRDGAGPPGPAGASGLIVAVLSGALNTGAGTLASRATELVAGIAAQSSQAASRLKTDQGVATSLATKLASTTGVSVDAELANLVKLQAAYTANARVLSATSTLWTTLFEAVR